MVAISASPMPCVVTAGVPIRRPEVMYGGRGSSGTVFSFRLMPARSRARRAFLPDRSSSKERRSTSIRWLSVPPDTSRRPWPASASASADALRTIWWAYSLNSGVMASAKAMALAATTWSSGPPCRPGKTDLSIASARSAVHRIAPARGPRSVLCVVSVMMSAPCSIGFGCTPPATSPAMWAASNSSSAPTSSAIWRKGTGSMMRG
jgi:hypothetical protein